MMEKSEQPTGHPATIMDNDHKGDDMGEKDQSSGSREVAPDAASSGEESEDETEYPKGFKLTLISIALCLSVFCMALVRFLLSLIFP